MRSVDDGKYYFDRHDCTFLSDTGDRVEDVDTYKAALDSAKLETYGITADDISAVQQVEVQCALEDGTVITNQTVYVVKIGHTWYVDNLTTDTTGIYAVETNA